MRLAEATSRDSVASSRLPSQRAIDSVTDQFASVLSATRRSSTRLLDMLKTGAARVESLGSIREQVRTEKSPGRTGSDRAASTTRKEARSARSDRAEPAEVEPREEPESQQPEPTPESLEEGGQALPAAAQVAPSSGRPSSGTEPAGVVMSSPGTPDAQGAIGPGVCAPPAAPGAAGGPAGPGAQMAAAGVVQGGSAAGGPAAPATAVAPPAAAGTAVAPIGSGEGASTATMESAAAGVAGKAAALRPGGSTGDFQELLQHLGRSRLGESTGAATSPPKAARTAQAAPETVDLQSVDGLEDLTRVVRSQVGSRTSSMALTLAPEELGRLRIDVQMQDDAVSLRFETQTAAGHDAIAGKLDDLRHALEQQGIRVDRVEVEFMPPAPNSSRHDAEQPSYGGQQWDMGGRQQDATGHARQSYDEPRHAGTDPGRLASETPAAVGAMPGTVDWARSGVDVIA